MKLGMETDGLDPWPMGLHMKLVNFSIAANFNGISIFSSCQ
jgi:hypothetical protein